MGRRQEKVHWFYDEVYRENYYVLFCENPGALIEFAKEQNADDLRTPPANRGGSCWVSDRGVYLWIGQGVKQGDVHMATTIAHEVGHAAVSVLMERGVPINPDCDEPFCYYLGYLVRKLTELAPKKSRRKGGGR